jgi:hypothetical protein
MKAHLAGAIVCVTLLAGCVSVHGGVGKVSYSSVPAGALRHIVLFQFNDDVSPATQHEVVEALRRLPVQIAEIRAFERGTEMSGRGLNHGFTHAAVFVFNNEEERDIYLAHPVHQEFLALFRPVVKEILVFNYWVQQ